MDRNDVQEAKHGRAAVLDLHDLIAAHVTLLDQTERVPHAQRRRDANVALREHRRLDGRARRREGRGREGRVRCVKRESHGVD